MSTPPSSQGPGRARPRVAMLQDGARLHYAVPIALRRAGVLARVFTDWYAAPWSFERAAARALRLVRPDLAAKMGGRYAPELDPRLVVRNPRLTLRLLRDRGRFGAPGHYFEHVARRLSEWVLSEDLGDANAFHGFVTNAHAILFEGMRRRGLLTTGDQIIAPACVERREALLQQERFPGWQDPAGTESLAVTDELERATWPHLDHVTCASDYVRDCLVEVGVAPERISMLPYPLDAGRYRAPDRRGRDGPVTAGFVGGVNLRKGAPYFKEVARRLAGPNLRFVMVGGVELTERAQQELRSASVELAGPVPRSEVQTWLDRFDLFLFPSTCEGSATAVMEAMASGLPVVTSPNAGSLVRDGVEGYVRKYDDVEGMCAAIERLATDGSLRLQMGLAARRRVEAFDLDWYSGELGSLFVGLLEARGKHPG